EHQQQGGRDGCENVSGHLFQRAMGRTALQCRHLLNEDRLTIGSIGHPWALVGNIGWWSAPSTFNGSAVQPTWTTI
ncbi:hypothetical protein M514_13683, partial [Trichuris suis]